MCILAAQLEVLSVSTCITYKGHTLLHMLIRCNFSPEFTTGQRYVYTGCSTGSLVSKYMYYL